MPKKPRAEMYMAVGLAKQGKTLFTATSTTTSGTRATASSSPRHQGLVMLVFTLPRSRTCSR